MAGGGAGWGRAAVPHAAGHLVSLSVSLNTVVNTPPFPSSAETSLEQGCRIRPLSASCCLRLCASVFPPVKWGLVMRLA